MASQYCQIISWIEHDKEHGDPEYAESLKDACLQNLLNKPRRTVGLTFFYPGDKKTRKEFCKTVFTAESREACEKFKRYILPDHFETCQSFKEKDVGNILGYKYEVESVSTSHVKFTNGMEIKSVKSFTTLNPNLENLVKIYIITHGEPAAEGEPYKIPISSTHKKTGGTKEDFQLLLSENLEKIKLLFLNRQYKIWGYLFLIAEFLLQKINENSDNKEKQNALKFLLAVLTIVIPPPENALFILSKAMFMVIEPAEKVLSAELKIIFTEVFSILNKSGVQSMDCNEYLEKLYSLLNSSSLLSAASSFKIESPSQIKELQNALLEELKKNKESSTVNMTITRFIEKYPHGVYFGQQVRPDISSLLLNQQYKDFFKIIIKWILMSIICTNIGEEDCVGIFSTWLSSNDKSVEEFFQMSIPSILTSNGLAVMIAPSDKSITPKIGFGDAFTGSSTSIMCAYEGGNTPNPAIFNM